MAIVARYDGNGTLRKFKIAGTAATEQEEKRIQDKLLEYAPPLAQPPAPKQDPSLAQSFGMGLDDAGTGLKHAWAEAQNALGFEDAAMANYKEVVKDREAAQAYEDQFKSPDDMWEEGRYLSFIGHGAARSAPQMAATVGAGAAGGLVAGPAGAVAGGVLVNTPMAFGSNLERQAQEHQGRVDAPGSAAGWAVPQGAADALINLVPGGTVGKAIGSTAAKIGLRSTEKLAADAAAAAIRSPGQATLIGMLKGAAEGAATELPTEIAQQAMERHQAGLDVFSDDAMKEYKQAALVAGAMGGSVGGVGRGFNERSEANVNTKARAQLEEDIASEQADAGLAAEQVQQAREFLAPDAVANADEAAAEAAYRRVMSTDFGLPAPSVTNAPRLADMSGVSRGEGFEMRDPNMFDRQSNREAASESSNAALQAQQMADQIALQARRDQATNRAPEPIDPVTNAAPEPETAPAPDLTERRQVAANRVPELPEVEAPAQRYVTPEAPDLAPVINRAPEKPAVIEAQKVETPEAPQFTIQTLQKGKPVADTAEGPGIAFVVQDSTGKRVSSPSPKRAAAEKVLAQRIETVKPKGLAQESLPGVMETPQVRPKPTPSQTVTTPTLEINATPLENSPNVQATSKVDERPEYDRVSQAVRDLGTMDVAKVAEASGVANPQQHYDTMVSRGEAVQRAPNDYRPSDQIGRQRQTTALPEDAAQTNMEVRAINRDGPVPENAGWVVADTKGNVVGEGYPSRKKAADAVKTDFAGKGYKTVRDPRAYAVMETSFDDSGVRTGERAVATFDTKEAADADLAARRPAPSAEPQYSPKIQAELDRRAAKRAEAEPKSPVGDTQKKAPEKPKTRAERFESDPAYQDARQRFHDTLGKLGLKNMQAEFKPFVDGPEDGVTHGKTTRSSETSQAADSVLQVSHAAHLSDSEGKKVGIERTTAEEAAHMLYNDIPYSDQYILDNETKRRKVGSRDYTYEQQAKRRAEGQDWSDARIREEAAAAMMADAFLEFDSTGDIKTSIPEAKSVLQKIWNWLRRIGRDQQNSAHARDILREFSEGRIGERAGGERVVRETGDAKTDVDTDGTQNESGVPDGGGAPVDAPKMKPSELERFSYSVAGPPGSRMAPTPIEVQARADFAHEYAATARVLEHYIGNKVYANVMESLPFVPKKGKGARTEQFAKGLAYLGRNFQDQFWDTGKFMDYVRKNGGWVTPDMDVAFKAEMFANRISDKEKVAMDKLYRPLFERSSHINMSGAQFDKLKNTNRVSREYLKTADNAAAKNTLALELFLYARAAKDRNKWIYENRFKDEQRADGTANRDGSGMTDAEADAILKAVDAMPDVKKRMESAADAVYAIRDDMKGQMLRDGLITQELHDDPGLGKYHVTLQDFLDEKNLGIEDDSDVYIGGFNPQRGVSTTGREQKQVGGRKSLAANIIPNTIAAHKRAISRGERNRVAVSLYDLIRLNQGNKSMGKGMNMPVDAFGEIVTNPPKIQQVVNGQTKEMVDPNWKDDDKIIMAKVGGREVGVRVPDEFSAFARELKPAVGTDPGKMNALLRGMATLNRYLSVLSTTYNPAFSPINPVRDIQSALVNSGQYDKGIATKLAKNLPSAMNAAREYAFAKNKGQAGNAKLAKDYEELRALGGVTGFMGLKTGEDIAASLSKEMQKLSTGEVKTFDKVVSALDKPRRAMEDIGQMFEDTTRLATYSALKESGMSPDRAAQAALNITVNFTRGGLAKQVMNALYLFYNAGLQGSMALFNAASRSPRVRKAIGAVAIMGALQVMMQEMFGERDEDGKLLYDKMTDEEKSRTWAIPTFGMTEGGMLKIPLPYGLNVAADTGRVMAELAYGKKKPGEALWQIGKGIAGMGNPLGQSANVANIIAPTFADPFVEMALNSDFAGRPITPEKRGASNLEVPESQNYFNSNKGPSVEFAKWLNEISGGSAIRSGFLDVSPEHIDHMAGFLTGGLGRFIGQSMFTGKMLSGNEDFDVNRIPILKSFYLQDTPDLDAKNYYTVREPVFQAYEEYRLAAKNGDWEQMEKLDKKYGPELMLAPQLKGLEAQKSAYTKAIAQMEKADDVPAAEKEATIKGYKDEQKALTREAMKLVNQMQKEKKAAGK